MLGILKIQYSGPCQLVNTRHNALEDSKDSSSFLGNTILLLIVERSVETIQIQISILRTFFERKGLANEATNWLNGLSNPTPLEPVNGL
jgi:hypothetical protein